MDQEHMLAEHLVVDSCAFIQNAPLQTLGRVLFTVPEVLGELRDKEVRERVRNLPYEIVLKESTQESLKMVTEISKKTGDYPSLSLTDLKLIALTHDLHLQHYGKDSINYDINRPVTQTESESAPKSADSIIGFHKVTTTESAKSKNDDWNESDEEDWVDENNLREAVLGSEEADALEIKDEKEQGDGKQIKVACLTSDFSIQNVLLSMKMNIGSADGMLIKRIKSYILRCRSCYHTTAVMTKEFCPKCGNKSLHRVSVTVDDAGVQHLHIDFEKLRVTRGMKHPIKTSKGGKHETMEQIFEDQRLPHNRMARAHQVVLDSSPFALNDVTSRSSLLGFRLGSEFGAGGGYQKNPNDQNGGGRRRKKK